MTGVQTCALPILDHPNQFTSTSQQVQEINLDNVHEIVLSELPYSFFANAVSLESVGGAGVLVMNTLGRYATVTGSTDTGLTLDAPLFTTDILTFYSSDFEVSSYGDLQITAHDHVWTFGADGMTTLPGNIFLNYGVEQDYNLTTNVGSNFTINNGKIGRAHV